MARAFLVAVGLLLCSATADRYHPKLEKASPQRNAPVINPLERTSKFWQDEAQDAITKRLNSYQNMKTARNVIMFLGDGMSIPTLAAARTYLGQLEGRTGEESQLSFEAFPTVGMAKTYCVDAQIADSACTSTAYLCGVKNNAGTLGVTSDVQWLDCDASTNTETHVKSIAAWAMEDGRDVGIVTTTRITHASPSGAYAHTANRDWETDADVRASGHDPARCPDIAHQLIHQYPGNQFKVILGGGRRAFRNSNIIDEEGSSGRRTDGRDLIAEWEASKSELNVPYRYVWNRTQLLEAPVDDGYLLGLFKANHMPFHLEDQEESEPTLAELTEAAIRRLERNPRGYFLFVEGGLIDHAHHGNVVRVALDETLELSKAVARAGELTGDDTLIVVTSDHAHVMAFNGYSYRGNNITGLSEDPTNAADAPYLTLSYTNGPGFRNHTADGRPDVTREEDFGGLFWQAHVDVKMFAETHGGDDVAVFAHGPRHHMFSGLYEQSQLPWLMGYAACIGPGQHACSAASLTAPASLLAIITVSLLINLSCFDNNVL